MSEKIELAMAIAKNAHKGDCYGSKDYYEYHLLNVYKRAIEIANSCDADKEVVGIVALLHDVVEDKDFPINIISYLFGDIVANAVNAISFYKDKESREDYYVRVMKDPIAKIVKLADSSENRFNCELDGKLERIEYYNKIVKLMSDEK